MDKHVYARSLVAVRANIPETAFTAAGLGTRREGSGVVISDRGLVLTIGYLITEAEEVWLTTEDGRVVAGHALAYDQQTGFGLIQALGHLDFAGLPPGKSGAGTPAIPAAIGLGAPIDYVTALGLDRIAAHEHDLLAYATERLAAIPGLRILGNAKDKASVISFVLEGVHPHDAGSILDHEGVVVRAGHHCAQPLMKRMNVPATTRASFAYFNTTDDVDALVAAVKKTLEIFHG